jgi:hypothetical protein
MGPAERDKLQRKAKKGKEEQDMQNKTGRQDMSWTGKRGKEVCDM